jgi:hypothetical protein
VLLCTAPTPIAGLMRLLVNPNRTGRGPIPCLVTRSVTRSLHYIFGHSLDPRLHPDILQRWTIASWVMQPTEFSIAISVTVSTRVVRIALGIGIDIPGPPLSIRNHIDVRRAGLRGFGLAGLEHGRSQLFGAAVLYELVNGVLSLALLRDGQRESVRHCAVCGLHSLA